MWGRVRGNFLGKVPPIPPQKPLSKKEKWVATLLAQTALCHAGRLEVAITAKRYIDVLGVTEDSVPYGLRIAALLATMLPCLPLRREGDRDLLAVEGEILIAYGVYANDRITTPPSPIRVPPPLTRGGKGSRIVCGKGVMPLLLFRRPACLWQVADATFPHKGRLTTSIVLSTDEKFDKKLRIYVVTVY